MLAEDLTAFFDPIAGFAVVATWKRADVDVTENVLFDQETQEPFGNQATANLREMRYPTHGAFADFAGGDVVEICGVAYKARPPRMEDDGAISMALMEKL